MDLIRTLLVYMMLAVGASTEGAPAVTPLPVTPTPAPSPIAVVVSSPIPAATATPAVRYTTLYVGDKGENVRKMQQRLKDLGYYSGKIDGQYGQQTRRAVEAFQTNNGLKVDGIAGRATLTVLYEGKGLATPGPNGTARPTATPPLNVTVPVYYVDQNGSILRRVDMVLYEGSTTIYANAANVSAGYTLLSDNAAVVTVSKGVAKPDSVYFRYQAAPTAAPAPQEISMPVIYMTDTGDVMLRESVTLPSGAITPVTVGHSIDESTFRLISPDTVNVTVSVQGAASPATVIFTYRFTEPTAAPESTATPEPTAEPTATPEPTAEPTATPEPTAEPSATPEPTAEPTATPEPTAEPTATPEPTAEPTATPEPTAEPTATPEPTTEPTTTPEPSATPEPTTEPTASPQPLSKGGDAMLLNGVTQSLSWYQDNKSNAYVSLKKLAQALGLSYTANAECVLNGHYVAAIYNDDSGIIALTVDEKNYEKNGALQSGDLLVNAHFLEAIGAEVTMSDGNLSIELSK